MGARVEYKDARLLCFIKILARELFKLSLLASFLVVISYFDRFELSSLFSLWLVSSVLSLLLLDISVGTSSKEGWDDEGDLRIEELTGTFICE